MKQVPNFVEFEEKLECSLQRDLTKMEHTRMRLGFEAQVAESLVLELQDLQLTIVRGTFRVCACSPCYLHAETSQPTTTIVTRA
jgi:hypothetical protein